MSEFSFKKLQEMSEQRLQELLREHQSGLRKMRFQATGGELKTVHKIGESRKLIARILTTLKERRVQPAQPSKVDKA